MNVAQVMAEGGWPAFAAAGLGGLGALVVVALVLRAAGRRSLHALGLASLTLATLTLSAGILLALYARSAIPGFVAEPNVVEEHQMVIRSREVGRLALFGLIAALVPLLFGAGAALAGARTKREVPTVAGASRHEQGGTSARTLVALVFVAVAGLLAAGACFTWRAPALTRHFSFSFADEDDAAWDLAETVDAMTIQDFGTYYAPDLMNCTELHRALTPFRKASRRPPGDVEWRLATELCRTSAGEAVSSLASNENCRWLEGAVGDLSDGDDPDHALDDDEAWRAAADACVRMVLSEWDAFPGEPDATWPRAKLLASPLLQSAELREEVRTFPERQAVTALQRAVDGLSVATDVDGCRRLERALEPFVGAKASRPPPEVAWQPAAHGCTKLAIGLLGETSVNEVTRIWSREELLASPLLQDDALRAQVLAWQPPTLGLGHRDGHVEAGAPVAKGSLPRELIQRVIRAHLGQVRSCYEKSLLHQPTLAGKLVVRFVIDAEGAVTEAADVSTPAFPEPEVPDCITARVKTWRFPKPQGGGVVVVTYPFIFEPAAP